MPSTTRTWRVAVVPADGSGVGVESDHGLTGCCDTLLQWSPDDTSILVMPEDTQRPGADAAPPARPVDRHVRAGAVDGERPLRPGSDRSLVGRPCPGVRPAASPDLSPRGLGSHHGVFAVPFALADFGFFGTFAFLSIAQPPAS